MNTNQPSRSQVTPRTIWTIGLNLLVLWTALTLVSGARIVVVWFLIALLVALAMEPGVRWLVGRGFRRGWAIAVTSLLALAVVGGMVWGLVPLVVEQGQALVSAAPDLLDRLEHHPAVEWADRRFGVLDRAEAALRKRAPGTAVPLLGAVVTLFQGVLGAVTIIALTIFILLFGPDVFTSGLAWINPSKRPRFRRVGDDMREAVGGYVVGTMIVAAVCGVLTTLGLLALGVPYFIPLGLLMAALSILPFVGSAIGAVVVVGTALATTGSQAAIIVGVSYLVYQQLEGNVLQPLVQQKTIQMNALLVTLALLFGTAVAGPLGTLLAVPIAAALQVLLKDLLAHRQSQWVEASGPVIIDNGT